MSDSSTTASSRRPELSSRACRTARSRARAERDDVEDHSMKPFQTDPGITVFHQPGRLARKDFAIGQAGEPRVR